METKTTAYVDCHYCNATHVAEWASFTYRGSRITIQAKHV